MKSSRWIVTLWLEILIASIPVVWAQQNPPHLAYVYPAGGRQGTTFQVKIGGQYLSGVSNAYVSGSGIQATIGEYSRPISNMQANQLRERLQELQKQANDPAVQKEIADIRKKLTTFAFRRNISPALAETVTLQITMAPDAAAGDREIRLSTSLGLSNPLIFRVGQLSEFSEKESDVVIFRPGNPQPQIDPTNKEVSITLPATVNGQINPGMARFQGQARQGQPMATGNVDRYRFQARQGQQLVVAASARDLIPYLADAVPGWFQAVVTLYDGQRKELAYDDDYRFHPDPVLHYAIPRDGEYVIEIKDSIYRGREDFVYRISLGELPFITSIFPLGGQSGAQTGIALTGWNLPVDKLVMDAADKGPGIYTVSVSQGGLTSNHLPFAVDTLPEIFEKETNNSPRNAQRVPLPVTINGRINQPGDADVFSFEGRAGQEIVAEVLARRLDSPLDSALRLTDASGQQIAFNDDHEDKGSGLNTHHADSLIMAALPGNGTYFLHLGDAQQKGGTEYAYRLRISSPRPDFALRVVPSAINLISGTTIPISVFALRQDGFAGDIALSLKGAPRGFILNGAVVPGGQDQVRLTLTVPPMPLKEPITLQMEGRSTIQGQEVVKAAVPADDMMQAFAYRHLVPSNYLKVAVPKRGVFRNPVRVLAEGPIKIAPGATARIPIQLVVPPNSAFNKMQFELSEPPDGIALQNASSEQQPTELVLQCDAAKAKAGLKGNLIVNVSAEREVPAGSGKAKANRQRFPLGTLPAIPFEIVK